MFSTSGVIYNGIFDPAISQLLVKRELLNNEIVTSIQALYKFIKSSETFNAEITAKKFHCFQNCDFLKADNYGNSLLHYLGIFAFMKNSNFLAYVQDFLIANHMIFLLDVPNENGQTCMDLFQTSVCSASKYQVQISIFFLILNSICSWQKCFRTQNLHLIWDPFGANLLYNG